MVFEDGDVDGSMAGVTVIGLDLNMEDMTLLRKINRGTFS
jgi:hypothetical protein